MWPDEQQQDGSSSSLSPSPGPDSPASHVRAGTTILINGSSLPASSNSSSSEVTPVGQSTPIQVAHMAYYPVVLSRQLEQMQSDLVHAAAQDYSPPPPPFSHSTNSSGTRSTGEPQGGTRLVAISNASLLAAASQGTHFIDCGKCQVKEMEIRQLRKRVHGLEEQLCRAIGSRPSSVKVLDPVVYSGKPQSLQQQQQPVTLQVSQFVPPPQTLRTVPPSPLAPSSHEDEEDDNNKLFKRRTPERAIGKSRGHSSVLGGHTILPVIGHTGSSSSSSEITSISGESTATIAKLSVMESQVASGKHGKDDDDTIELVPGTNVCISTARLQQILSIVKTGKQLARKLMSVYWDRMILARSTLSAASQHYEQLDPKIISAIKTYCVLFDGSARKSEIHSTMIDKCVQARRPRRSSLKQQQQESTTTPRLHQVMDIGTIGRPLMTTSVPVTPPPAPPQYIVSQVIGGKEQYHIEGAGTTAGTQQQPEVVHVTSPYQFTSHHHHSIHQLDTTTTTSGSLTDEEDEDEEEEEEEEEGSERVLTIHS